MPAKPWRHLYDTAHWKRIRLAKLAQDPLCEWCLEQEIVTAATEVHHVHAHKGDLDLFYKGPFRSTCKSCHSSRGQLEDHGKTVVRFDHTGWPI